MKDTILTHLKAHHRTRIQLSHLEGLFAGDVTYEQFARVIQSLVREGLIKPVMAGGTNGKSVALYNTYRINKHLLKNSLVEEIQHYALLIHPEIKLNNYISLPEEEWQQDLPWIKKMDLYLKTKGLPEEEATGPERSLELFGDEKWIDEKGGKRVLERVQLWDKLKITGVPDPLMLALNPSSITGQRHRHLIVENKAVFYTLLDLLPGSTWTSLIFGAGWKIVANLRMAVPQLGLQGQAHTFYYFGDLDPEGIAIWYRLRQKHSLELALPFYQALLAKPHSLGKETQQQNPAALKAFYAQFPPREAEMLKSIISQGGYLPQEALAKEELAGIWRDRTWNI